MSRLHRSYRKRLFSLVCLVYFWGEWMAMTIGDVFGQQCDEWITVWSSAEMFSLKAFNKPSRKANVIALLFVCEGILTNYAFAQHIWSSAMLGCQEKEIMNASNIARSRGIESTHTKELLQRKKKQENHFAGNFVNFILVPQ